jgi:hypothetical protein
MNRPRLTESVRTNGKDEAVPVTKKPSNRSAQCQPLSNFEFAEFHWANLPICMVRSLTAREKLVDEESLRQCISLFVEMCLHTYFVGVAGAPTRFSSVSAAG